MLKKSSAVYLFAILCTLIVTPAQARVRSFVASYGNDANPCGPFLPCGTFARALTVTDNNGEVVALDSSGYGPITINQSVTLMAPPSVFVGIAVATGSGVTINGGANVVLRGLTINGQGGVNGILMNGSGNLSIENCIISNFSATGVLVDAAATVRMVDTLVRNNTIGIQLQKGATTDISGSKFLGNNTGIFAIDTTGTTTAVTISDTLVTGGLANGIEASGTGFTLIDVIRATVTDNTVGVKTSATNAKITLSDSMVTGNGTGLSWTTGTLKSLGNNTVMDNGNNSSAANSSPSLPSLVDPM